MDILCSRCGEPWDVCSLVDDMNPLEARRLKSGIGCPCCYGKHPCDKEVICQDCEHYSPNHIINSCTLNLFKPINDAGREAMSVLTVVLGDDIDGIASTLEDFGLT